jgi:hypothetical protein
MSPKLTASTCWGLLASDKKTPLSSIMNDLQAMAGAQLDLNLPTSIL